MWCSYVACCLDTSSVRKYYDTSGGIQLKKEGPNLNIAIVEQMLLTPPLSVFSPFSFISVTITWSWPCFLAAADTKWSDWLMVHVISDNKDSGKEEKQN